MLRTESPQPVHKKGSKAIDCPSYGDCLMYAARNNWSAWTCEECPNLRLDSVYQKLRFIAPYYQLLAEIYPEFKRKYEPAIDPLTLER